MIDNRHILALRSLLSDDTVESDDPLKQVGLTGMKTFSVLITAAFTVAVRRKFVTSYTHADTIRLVADIRSDIDAAEDIEPRTAELLIRAALGEHSSESLDDRRKLEAQIVILEALVTAEEMEAADLDTFLREATDLAEVWLGTLKSP